MPEIYEYTGIIHIHTTHSDGSGSVQEIIDIAKKMEIDYLILTDHFNNNAKFNIEKQNIKTPYVIVGYEWNDTNEKNHTLVLNPKSIIKSCDLDEFLSLTQEKEEATIMAHPDEERHYLEEYPPYNWTVWDDNRLDGIEIWNFMSQWMENLRAHNKILMYLFPFWKIKSPTKKILEYWNYKNQEYKFPAIAGSDIHASKIRYFKFLNLTIFRYSLGFATLRTNLHLFEPLPREEKLPNIINKILYSIIEGNTFIINQNGKLYPIKGFKCYLQQNGKYYNIGSTVFIKNGQIRMKITVPIRGILKLFHNGNLITSLRILRRYKEIVLPIKEKGIYRIEVHRWGKTIIMTNHFYIKE